MLLSSRKEKEGEYGRVWQAVSRQFLTQVVHSPSTFLSSQPLFLFLLLFSNSKSLVCHCSPLLFNSKVSRSPLLPPLSLPQREASSSYSEGGRSTLPPTPPSSFLVREKEKSSSMQLNILLLSPLFFFPVTRHFPPLALWIPQRETTVRGGLWQPDGPYRLTASEGNAICPSPSVSCNPSLHFFG